jgi:hypothetical protein
MKVSFDGPNKLIHVLPGVGSLDVKADIYSRWKDWIMVTDNAKYLQALRTTGGDPTNPSNTEFAPRYYFLTNGWRVKVDGLTVIVQLNLYTDEGVSPFIVVNNGAVTNRGSDAPNTVTDLPEIQYASYNGGVTYQASSPYSGTEYPVGTLRMPVNNIPDAGTIATLRGFNKGYILDSLTMDGSVVISGFIMVGQGGERTTINILPEAVAADCSFYDCHLTGTLDGNSRATGCKITNLHYVNGYLDRCILEPGTITLGGGNNGEAHLLDCYSGVAGTGTPTIDMGGTGQGMTIRNFNGGIKLINKTGPESVSIDLNSGQVKLEMASITNGTIVVRGIGKLVNSVTEEHIISGTYGNLVIINELINNPATAKAVWEYTR